MKQLQQEQRAALTLWHGTHCVRKPTRCKSAKRFLKSAVSYRATWERNLQVIVCGEISAANSLFYSLLRSQQYYIPPDGRCTSASSFQSSYRRLKNSSPVISSPHTFPFSQYPVQTFCALTGNHPELRLSVPVVLSGSYSASAAVKNNALLFVSKTPIPTRLCSSGVAKGWRGIPLYCPASHYHDITIVMTFIFLKIIIIKIIIII